MIDQDTFNPKPRRRQSRAIPLCYLAILPLIAWVSQPAYSQDFGILFTSPEEREYLDFLRDDFVRRNQSASFNIQEDVIPDIPVVEEEVVVQEVTIYSFGGTMTSQNGNRQVWLNGRQVAESDLPNNIRLVDTAAGALLVITSNGSTFQLKAGQTFNSEAGVVQASYLVSTPAQGASGNSPRTTESTQSTTPETNEAPATSPDTNESDGPDLGQILQSLGADNESASESQLQQALEILSELSESPQ